MIAPVSLAVFLFTQPIPARVGETIFAFRNYSRPKPERMILVGEIQNKTKMPELKNRESPFLGYDSRLDQVTVKILDRRGLKVGQKLYVIDKDPFHNQFRDGLIVGEIEVVSILNSPFYGWVLTGKGIMLRVRKGHFVARTLETERLERAYILKKKGDHFRERGAFKEALRSYNEALIADRTLPEANAALGDLYLEMDQGSRRATPERSLAAFERAWRSRVNFKYDFDALHFYEQYARTLLLQYELRQLESSREDHLERYLEQVLAVANAARRVAGHDHWPDLLEAQARFQRYQLLASERNAAERRQRDEDYERCGQILKAALDQGQSSADLAHIGILYYYAMLVKGGRQTKADQDRRERLHRVLARLVRDYNRHFARRQRDPRVDQIIRDLESNP
ncbi:MAG: tetratricopeptide repeat protein [Leptospiraceae bacterium]|nr:tetratricopeptide repeat protein [Leptospiraceae bacterium]